MTSKLSFNKNRPFLNLFLFTLKKNIPLTVLGTIVAVLLMPVLTVTVVTNEFTYVDNNSLSHTVLEVLRTTGVFLMLLSSLMTIVLTVINLGYMHGRSASDMYHALPITRKGLFLARWLPVWICSFIPLAVATGITAIIALVWWPFEAVNVSFILLFLGMSCLSIFICSVFTALLMVLTGTIFDMLISQLAINLGIPILYALAQMYFSEILFGYSTEYTADIAFQLSPFSFFVYNGWQVLQFFDKANVEVYYFPLAMLVWLIFGIVMLVAALWLYKKRKSETAGEPYAGKFLPRLLQVIVCLGAAILFGEGFAGQSDQGVAYYVFASIGSLLGAVILGAIIRRGFKGIKNDIVVGAASMVILAVMFGILYTGGLGYESRIPKASDVKSVSISLPNQNIYYEHGITLKEEQSIKNVIALHKAIVENREEIQKQSKKIYGDNYAITSSMSISFVSIEYQLSMGRTMKRNLMCFPNELQELINAISSSDEYQMQFMNYLLGTGVNTLGGGEVVYGDIYYDEFYNAGNLTISFNKPLFDRVIKAYFDDAKDGASQDKIVTISFYEYSGRSRGATLFLSKQHTRTLAILEELGYKEQLRKQHQMNQNINSKAY